MKIPHPWWHYFYTEIAFHSGFRSYDKSYWVHTCSKCKKVYYEEYKDKSKDYESKIL